MNLPITTTLSENMFHFLKKEAKQQKTSCKSIIETALKEYQKQKLKKEVEKDLKLRQEEYVKIQKNFSKAQIENNFLNE